MWRCGCHEDGRPPRQQRQEVAYLVCIAGGVLWPTVFGMKAFFPSIFPGFTWLDPLSFVLGLVEVALYGLAAAAVAMIAWNFVADRTTKAAG